MFYAFETFEQYQDFLNWMQQNAAPCDPVATEQELQLNLQIATAEIMEAFKDPFFHSQDSKNTELEEIDF